jgi:hypothetical protein
MVVALISLFFFFFRQYRCTGRRTYECQDLTKFAICSYQPWSRRENCFLIPTFVSPRVLQ